MYDFSIFCAFWSLTNAKIFFFGKTEFTAINLKGWSLYEHLHWPEQREYSGHILLRASGTKVTYDQKCVAYNMYLSLSLLYWFLFMFLSHFYIDFHLCCLLHCVLIIIYAPYFAPFQLHILAISSHPFPAPHFGHYFAPFQLHILAIISPLSSSTIWPKYCGRVGVKSVLLIK